MSYDFTDDQILNLVKVTHFPTEVQLTEPDSTKPGEPVELLLVCSADRSPWPCPAVVGMRKHLDAKSKQDAPVNVAAAERVAKLIAEGKIR